MKKRFIARLKNFSRLQLIALIVILALATITFAATVTDYLSGYSWSANIGWIHGGNCANPNDPATCKIKSPYNIRIDSTSGAITGYAWSSNIGWINFSPTTCPSGSCQAKVNWTANGGKGPYPVAGWAQACSVYGSSCSGNYVSADYRGNNHKDTTGAWDGFIALGGSWASPVVISSDGKSMTGYAWGGDVVGWVQMNFTVTQDNHTPECSDKVDNEDTEDTLPDAQDPGCHTDGDQTNPASYDPTDDDETNGPIAAITNFAGVCVDKKPYLTWETTNVNECGISFDSQTSVVTKANSEDVTGSAKQTGGKYYVEQAYGTDLTPSYALSCRGTWGPLVKSSTVTINLNAQGQCGGTVVTQCPAGTHEDNGACCDANTHNDGTGKCVEDGGGGGGDDKKQCADGIDNDGDGKIDYTFDKDGNYIGDIGCTSPDDDSEFNAIYEEH